VLQQSANAGRFADLDALAGYLRGVFTAAIMAHWPKTNLGSGGISKAIHDLNRKNNAAILEAAGIGWAAEQCRIGGSCPH
jgi:hypothetical protein